MNLWEQTWFIKTVTWLNNNWPWWKKQIWGYSINMEDFVRNPAEELRDNCFPFCFKDVNPKSYLFRYKFFPYLETLVGWYATYSSNPSTYHKIYPNPVWEKVWKYDNCYYVSSLVIDKWVTKYPNATFMLQFIASWKFGCIPISFVSCNIRINELTYWQFGAGWGPQWANYDGKHPDEEGKINAVMCGKFRYVKYADESLFNPSDVYGYFEGDV